MLWSMNHMDIIHLGILAEDLLGAGFSMVRFIALPQPVLPFSIIDALERDKPSIKGFAGNN
jgi:hypothetical protein